MSSANPLRIGLVGAGSIAQVAELPSLAGRPDVQLVGLVSRDPERASANLRRWPIERAYPSLESMLDDARPDALVVLTPKDDHTRFVRAGLEAGIDVFCEKPLASSLPEAREMAGLAVDRGRILMVGFNRRYAETYVRARKRFAAEPPRFVVAQKNRPGSEYRATLENAIHMVDLLRWFCGEAVDVTAHAIAQDPYMEDGLAALIRFDSGAVGVLMAARCAGEWDERLEAYGDNATVRVIAPDSVSSAEDGMTQVIELRPRASGWQQATVALGFAAEIDHFIECVAERKEPLTSGRDAVLTQELTEQVIRLAGLPTTDRQAMPAQSTAQENAS